MPNRKINITFDISEGPEVFVDRINITGNTRSQEKILRREVPMAEGDLFTSQKLARARQRLVNLNYFETVNATTAPGATKDKIIVNIDVVEKPTGLFSIGGGYSSQDSFIGTVDLSQRNFLGRGWEVFIRLRGGAQTQQGQIGFTEPWLFDRPLSAGFDLFNNRRVFDDYTVNSLGGDIRFGYPIGEYSRANADLPGEPGPDQRRVRDCEQRPPARGGHPLHVARGRLPEPRYPRQRVRADPRDATRASGRTSRASGSATSGFGCLASTSYFHPTPWLDHVIGVRVSGAYALGWGNDPVPLFERFFLGGANSIRSFKAQQISPRIRPGRGSAAISSSSGISNTPFRCIFGIRVAAFYDVGNVWGPDIADGLKFDITDLKQAIGLGVRWVSPFGPIRVDYGVNPNPKRGEDFGAFSFSVGSAF